ncbi:rCG46273 [Rattus norvegicus]|uniref:RCG46273 n=1 Tax=Rattus norvegicus TaxID=10116 RepID=A6ICM3_RAT|nr:rCG46273 [Rattus norvegicus]
MRNGLPQSCLHSLAQASTIELHLVLLWLPLTLILLNPCFKDWCDSQGPPSWQIMSKLPEGQSSCEYYTILPILEDTDLHRSVKVYNCVI